jgi:hypothetical protein
MIDQVISGYHLISMRSHQPFDTVEWSFIEKTLQFYGFGPSLQKWIKAFSSFQADRTFSSHYFNN